MKYKKYVIMYLTSRSKNWRGLWCLMPLSTYHGGQLYWWR